MKTTSTARLLFGSQGTLRTAHAKHLNLFVCCLWVLAATTATFGQAPKIKITEPTVKAGTVFLSQGAVDLSFTAKDMAKIRVLVTTTVDAARRDIDLDADKEEQSITVVLFKGANKIQLIGFKGEEPDPKITASIAVTCTGKKCGAVVPEDEAAGQKKPSKTAGNISILQPSGRNVDNGLINSVITVKKSAIQRVFVQVINDGKTIEQPKSLISVKYVDELALLRPTLKIGKGKNVITVFNPDEPIETTDKFSTTVTCAGDKCDAPEIVKVTGGVHIEAPEGGAKLDKELVDSNITVEKKSGIAHLFVLVLNKGKEVKQDNNPLDVDYKEKTQVSLNPKIRVGKGKNIITVFDADKSLDDSPQDSTEVNCEGDKCGAAEAKAALITIQKPKAETEVKESSVDTYLNISKDSGISKIKYEVSNENGLTATSDEIVVPAAEGDKPVDLPVRVRILKGKNTIRFFNPDKQENLEMQATTVVSCKGDKCASDFDIAKFASNSQNSRAVVGMEQTGASSATSELKPFLDFFFTTPLLFNKCAPLPPPPAVATQEQIDKLATCKAERRPRLAAWGDIRITSTPDQIAAASVFPSNFVNQLGKASNTVDLVQSFDFLAGLEVRIKSANGHFLSLIPGLNQRTHFYLAGGGGAINPLTARRELAQIFKVPTPTSPQYDDFIKRYGKPPTTTPAKDFVGLVPLDRDRFLRQWYVGIRLKTLYCDNPECTRFKNHFPAIVDFMFGQNEAVTGGSLKYTRVDPSDPKKTIQKNSYVLRVDAFYPFPIKEANFLYFYGSAVMKIGAGGVRVQNPLFLDVAPGDVLITDTRVYIPPSNLQMLFQPSRDYYKIGVGVNLTDLFNRNKTSQ